MTGYSFVMNNYDWCFIYLCFKFTFVRILRDTFRFVLFPSSRYTFSFNAALEVVYRMPSSLPPRYAFLIHAAFKRVSSLVHLPSPSSRYTFLIHATFGRVSSLVCLPSPSQRCAYGKDYTTQNLL